MSEERIKLAIVDDHNIVITGIKGVLTEAKDVELCITAASGQELLNLLETQSIDVIVMDINLPDIDGMELCKAVKKKYKSCKVIGLTTYTQVSFIVQMLRNGADGYLFKNTSEEELLAAIATVHAGGRYLSQEVNEKMVQKAMDDSESDEGFIPQLTRRETEVLQLIMEENTNQQIADKLFLSLSTIETHRMNLCSKLDVKNSVGLVKKVIKFGLG